MRKKVLFCIIFVAIVIQLFDTNGHVYAANDGEKIEEGIYKIVLANDESQSMAVENLTPGYGANVKIETYSENVNQMFRIKNDAAGYQEIIPVYSGKRVDIAGWGNGVNVEQWGENKMSDSQQFRIVKSNKGNYNIIGKRDNLYLTAQKKGKNGYINIEGYQKNNLENQEFKLEKIQTPDEGIYKIVLANSTWQSVTVKDGSIKNGRNVQVMRYENSVKQQYQIKYDNDGYLEIIPVFSEKRLDLCGWGNGANVEQWCENQNTDSQKWTIIKNKNGNYNIVCKRKNLYLTAHDSNASNGTNIEGNEKNWQIGQEFKLEKVTSNKTVEEGTYKITMASNRNKSISIQDNSVNGGANVQLREYSNSYAQQFNLAYDGNGYYEIIAVNSGKRLDVCGWGNGTNISQWSANPNTDSQKWKIKKNANGNYSIISKRQNLYLTIHNSNLYDGANVEAYEKNGEIGQEFYLEKVENKSERIMEEGSYKMMMSDNNNMVVETAGGDYSNYGRQQIWQNYDTAWQRVNLTYQNGFYKIEMAHSGKCLTVMYGMSSIDSNILQYEFNWGENQKWVIRDIGNGNFIVCPLSNWTYALNTDESIQNGSVLNLNYNLQSSTEKFKFERYYERYAEEGTYGWSGLKVKGNGNGGEYLRFYKVGNGNKKLFLNFSIHGFEDSYSHDGAELTYLADEFYSYMKKNMPIDLINKWTVYILPMSNPDGQHNGWTNNGPGRTTLYSWAAGNQGIDMNRCFPVNYKSTTNSSRNYNGTQPLQAFEAESLRNFVLSNTGSQNVVIDVHGWLNETIGDDVIGRYYRNQFGISKHIGTYGSGYFIQWARTVRNTRSMLLELPEVNSHNQVLERNYSNKFINATIQLLREI